MTLQRRETASRLSESMRHYALTGCYLGAGTGEERLAVILLAGFVLRNRLDELEQLWAIWGATAKASHRGEAFAEMVLRIRDWRQWPGMYGPGACREQAHNHEAPNTR